MQPHLKGRRVTRPKEYSVCRDGVLLAIRHPLTRGAQDRPADTSNATNSVLQLLAELEAQERSLQSSYGELIQVPPPLT